MLDDFDELTESDLELLARFENMGKGNEKSKQTGEDANKFDVNDDVYVADYASPNAEGDTPSKSASSGEPTDAPESDAEVEATDGEQHDIEESFFEPDKFKDNLPESAENLTHEQRYDDLPAGEARCDDHCEDTEQEDSDGEICQHCMERLRREREEWGVIAYDRNGEYIFPGAKLAVVITNPLIQVGTFVSANVPNRELGRYAETTGGEADLDLLWLSGHGISQFTGYHLSGDRGAIRPFKKGDKLSIVERVADIPTHEDIDNLVEDFANSIPDALDEPKPPITPEEPEDIPDEAEDEGRSDDDEEPEFSDDEIEEMSNETKRDFRDTTKEDDLEDFTLIAEEILDTAVRASDEEDVGTMTEHVGNMSAHLVTFTHNGVEYSIMIAAQRKDKE